MLRYGCAGLGLFVFGWLIARGGRLPRPLGWVGMFGGGLLVLVYFGRLFDFIMPASHTSLIPPFLYGVVVHPVFYGWFGALPWLGRRPPAVAPPPAAAD